MADADKPNLHFVCSRPEAAELIRAAPGWWIGDCGCRTASRGCQRSQTDICLEFSETTAAENRVRRKATRNEALDLLRVAEQKHLVTRPFRDDTRTQADGICFCCDCCCGYFRGKDYSCDKGKLIERTDPDACTDCGDCVGVCYFSARTVTGNRLEVNRNNCYGCGLCLDVCPVGCIRLEPR